LLNIYCYGSKIEINDPLFIIKNGHFTAKAVKSLKYRKQERIRVKIKNPAISDRVFSSQVQKGTN
jgi:hypothetical protein